VIAAAMSVVKQSDKGGRSGDAPEPGRIR